MTRIFLSFAHEDVTCAEQLRTGLEARGYTVWREPGYPDARSASYPRMIEGAIVGSAAVILVWSQHADQAAEVERHLLFAQVLKKPVFPVVLDGTALPNTLVAGSPLTVSTTCTDAIAALVAMASFPPAHATDALITLSELAAHEYIRERKEAIEQAAALLARGEHQEEALALLTYLARNDAIMGVREEAQKVLDAEARKAAPVPPPVFRPEDARHIFGVRCKQGHVSYFDKRVECGKAKKILRRVDQAGEELDELDLKCDTCGESIVKCVDCGGY